MAPRPLRRTPARFSAACAVATAVALVVPGLAEAHAFLIRSTPAPGSRLTASPRQLVLYLSEPYVGSSEQVTVRRADGATVKLQRPTGRGATVEQQLPPGLRGVYVVSWQVLSDDGHISLGAFAFAVSSSGALPTLHASAGRTPWSQVLASWLVLAGLALAFGGIVSERFVWRLLPAREDAVARSPAGVGVALALAGALLQLVLLAGARRGSGFSAGLHGAALSDVLATRPGKLTLALLVSLAISGVATRFRLSRTAALVPLVAAIAFNAARGHSGTAPNIWPAVADTVHVAAAALWIGALVHLVVVVARSGEREAVLASGIRRYSRFALPTVLVVVASGVVTAVPEFASVGDVFSSRYGQILIVKATLIVVVLSLAGLGRLRALTGDPRVRVSLLRRLTRSETAGLAAVLAAVAFLVNAAPPRSSAASAVTSLGAAPLTGRVLQLADLAGQYVVAIAANGRELQFTVVPPSNQVRDNSVSLSGSALLPDGRDDTLDPRPCGGGCFTLPFKLTAGVTHITVDVASRTSKGGRVHFTVHAPLAREQPAIVGRIAAAMRKVSSLRVREVVTSGPGSRPRPATYELSGRAFIATEAFTGGAVDARPIARTEGLTEVAFALPGSNIWYRAWIDGRDRLQRELILSQGHRISRTFRYPTVRGGSASAPPPARPPAFVSTSAPRPPDAPLVLGRQVRDLAVGLAAFPQPHALRLTATVIDGTAHGAANLAITFTVNSGHSTRTVRARPCGAGCYRAEVVLAGAAPRAMKLWLAQLGQVPVSLTFPFPSQWPPRSAVTLVRDATRVFRHLQKVAFDESLESNPAVVVRSHWRLQAPDRLSYSIAGGSEAVVIGSRRWDRDPGGAWQLSTISGPLPQPIAPWVDVPATASLLGSAVLHGRHVWLVSFLNPDLPAWYTLAIEKKTLRTLHMRMTAPAHFMTQSFSMFNTGSEIVPPPGAPG
ncbi:MAG: copper resistance CopC/CopD family protein [Gaiellaceae bacterium]